jgi:8-oxo-dGTP pyrophosphatase MutT (NUDIX family)
MARTSEMTASAHGGFEIIAAVLTHDDRLCLLRRSAQVKTDRGYWHCITGYLATGASPLEHAFIEINEETGIDRCDLELQSRAIVDRKGADGNSWRIHAFHFRSRTRTLALNWEHDGACWTPMRKVRRLRTVHWLAAVLEGLSLTIDMAESRDGDAAVARELAALALGQAGSA